LAEWWKTPIVSWPGKIRASLELLIPARPSEERSLARFVEHRLGREVLERLAQPLVGGIYGGEPERLSLDATMPRFVELERRYGSVIRGLARSESERAASGARYGLFFSFDRGMRVLIDALAAKLGPRLMLDRSVHALERKGAGWIVRSESAFEADHVVLATGAIRSAALIAPHHRRWSDALRSIPHGSAVTVTMAWPRERIPHELDAFGMVVPSVERRPVLAATFSSVKWPGRAPNGQALIRVFVGGAHAPDAVDRDDATLIAIARRELRSLLGIESVPHFSIVVRYRDAMPQYHLGHRARASAIEAMQAELGTVWIAGNALHGVGIPDTIRDAEHQAESIANCGARIPSVGAPSGKRS
jgi:oxygen-dependent protoporphyrinogen oxidase